MFALLEVSVNMLKNWYMYCEFKCLNDSIILIESFFTCFWLFGIIYRA